MLFKASLLCDLCTNELNFIEIETPYTLKQLKASAANAKWLVRKSTSRTLCPTCRKAVE